MTTRYTTQGTLSGAEAALFDLIRESNRALRRMSDLPVHDRIRFRNAIRDAAHSLGYDDIYSDDLQNLV